MTNYQEFIQWAKENGAILNELSLNTYANNERGIHSIKGIRKSKTIVKIPLKIIIHDGMGEATDVGNIIKIYKKHFQNYKIIQVMIYMLLTYKNKDSFFSPYYNILPKNTSNFPIFWLKDYLKYMSGSDILSQIIIRQNSIILDYENICKFVPRFKTIATVKEFIWMRTIVGSRNFGININGINRSAMVPISDLLNHNIEPDVNWYFDNREKYFKMVSNKYIRQNTPITDTYGNKSNIKYFLYYGFTIPNNISDILYVKLVHGSTNKQLKDELCENVTGYLKIANESIFLNDLLYFLRVSTSSQKVLKANRNPYFYRKITSSDRELIMLNAFKIYLNTLLKNYVYYDELKNEQLEKFSKKWNSFNLIDGEINVIKFYLQQIENAENIINGNNTDLIIKSNYLKMLKNFIETDKKYQ